MTKYGGGHHKDKTRPEDLNVLPYDKTSKIPQFIDQLGDYDRVSNGQPETQESQATLSNTLITKTDFLAQTQKLRPKSQENTFSIKKSLNRTLLNASLQKIKLTHYNDFKRPNKSIRNRLQSETLTSLLDQNEIEALAKRALEHKKQSQERRFRSTQDVKKEVKEVQEEVKSQAQNEVLTKVNRAQFKSVSGSRKSAIIAKRQQVTVSKLDTSFDHSRSEQRQSLIKRFKATFINTETRNTMKDAKSSFENRTFNNTPDTFASTLNQTYNYTTQQPSRITNLLEKAKATTAKSKVSEFRDESQEVEKRNNQFNLNQLLRTSYGVSTKPLKADPISIQVMDSFTTNQETLAKSKLKFMRSKLGAMENQLLANQREEQREYEENVSKILYDLEHDIDEGYKQLQEELKLEVKEFTLDFNRMQQRINDMKNPDFWLQKALQMSKATSVESSIDYYKQGLRINPTSEKLLFNIACCFEKIGKYENTIRWLKHALNVKPRWTDAHYVISVVYFKLGKYHEALTNIEYAISFYREALMPLDVMIYLRAMCYKKVGDFTKATRDYKQLLYTLNKNEHKDLVKYIFGILLLPLQEDRKLQFDFIENTQELLEFYSNQSKSKQSKSNFLVNYKSSTNPYLDFDSAKKEQLMQLLINKPFFKRFSPEIIEKFLRKAKPKKFDEKDDLVFLDGQVGVITNGSIIVKSHDRDILKPRVICKHGPGMILGFSEVDGGVTNQAQTWLLTGEPNTEIVFFKQEIFSYLWKQQNFQTSQQIIKFTLEKNSFFKHLTIQWKRYLVYECLRERSFEPNELIVSQSQRSPLNATYKPFLENRQSKLKQDIEMKKNQENGGLVSEYKSFMGTLRDSKKKKTLNPTPGFAQANLNTSGLKGSQEEDQDIQNQVSFVQNSARKKTSSFVNTRKSSYVNNSDERKLDGIYIIAEGTVDIVLDEIGIHQLHSGESFGESPILKTPVSFVNNLQSYEYFGDMVAGESGAVCYFFPYKELKRISFIELQKILEGDFIKKKEGLFHIVSQRYNVDINVLKRY